MNSRMEIRLSFGHSWPVLAVSLPWLILLLKGAVVNGIHKKFKKFKKTTQRCGKFLRID